MRHLLLLMLALAAPTAHAVSALHSEPSGQRCPTFEQCTDSGCAPISAGARWLTIDGMRVPDTRTNYPLVNAGLHFLKQGGSNRYLADAMRALCTRGATSPVRCDDSLFLGKASNSASYYDVWASLGYVPEGRHAETQLGRASGACLEYARLDGNLADALKPSIQLQSANLSEEGIRLRAQLMKLLAFAPVIQGRCAQEAASIGNAVNSRSCLELSTYFDDLRFALLLADKLATDGRADKTWILLRATGRSVLLLAAIAVNATPIGSNPAAYLAAIDTLVSDDSAAIRGAIRQAL